MDPSLLMRKWISAQLPTDRISVAILPAFNDKNNTGFNPADGPWIVVALAGGRFQNSIFFGVIQITVYAGVDEVLSAITTSGQIRGLINEKNHIDLSPDGYVLRCDDDTSGMPSAEGDAGYATAVSMHEVILRSN